LSISSPKDAASSLTEVASLPITKEMGLLIKENIQLGGAHRARG